MALATYLTIEIQTAFPGPSGEPSYTPLTGTYAPMYMDPDVPGMEVLYRVTGRLVEILSGNGVSGKTISATYDAGTSFGSDTTDGDGYYVIDEGLQEAPDPQKLMTVTFAGDAGFLTSSNVKTFSLNLIPTTLVYTEIPGQFPEDQYFVIKGTVTVNWDEWYFHGSPVEGMDVDLVVNTVVEQTVATDSEGKFKLYHVFPDEIWRIIQIQTNDTAVYSGEITPYVSMHIVDHWYPQPEEVETDCYAWLLCIDPNSIRGGPMYYVLDKASVKPGLTDKTGTFAGQLNDNQKTRPADDFIQYAMYLLGEDKTFILDQDEFWIGLQRGAVAKRYDPENYSWDYQGGTDNKGSGVHWMMGGYITKRYYSRASKKRVTAMILGKCYMDVWKDQLFGTDAIPRAYTEPTGLDVIANDVLADVNAQQAEDYKYTYHPAYWQSGAATLTVSASYGATLLEVNDVSGFTIGDAIKISDANGSEELQVIGITDTAYLQQLDIQSYPTVDPVNPGIQAVLGYDKASATVSTLTGLMSTTWKKTFVDDNPFDIMQEMCQEAIFEFRINYLKQVMFYPKSTPPEATNRDIRYDTNIRSVPEIVMGDTENIITDVTVRDGFPKTHPANIDLWSSVPGAWYEIGNSGLRIYGYTGRVAPANPVTEAYTDSSLVFDDESRPALCFQHEGAEKQFLLHFWYRLVDNALGSGATVVSANMNLDLRTYRRLKWKWRHVTWNGVKPDRSLGITGNVYAIQLHTALNDHFYFDFGTGYQETLGHSSNDLIEASASTVGIPQDTLWKFLDLLLPEPDGEGNISYIDIDQMKGWQVTGNPDPTEINWVSFFIQLPEATPNSGYARSSGFKTLTDNPAAGDNHVTVDNPENLAGFQSGSQTKEFIMLPGLAAEIDGEGVQLDVLYPRSSPSGSENIRLAAPLIGNPGIGDELRILAGKTFAFSQLRFERDFQVLGEGSASTLTVGPKRYRLYEEEEIDFQTQAESKVTEVLNVEGVPRRWVKVIIDGDPEKEVGTSVRVFLDPNHNAVFENINMMVDDVEYTLNAVNLEMDLTLTPLSISPKAREVDEFNVSDRANLGSRRRNNRDRKNFRERRGGEYLN